MPIYRWKCNNCSHEFEQLYLSFSTAEKEEKEESCPKCASKDKTKCVNNSSSFQLKGRGWAKDKYGR